MHAVFRPLFFRVIHTQHMRIISPRTCSTVSLCPSVTRGWYCIEMTEPTNEAQAVNAELKPRTLYSFPTQKFCVIFKRSYLMSRRHENIAIFDHL